MRAVHQHHFAPRNDAARARLREREYRFADETRCATFGVDPDKAESIARRIARAAADAKKIGLVIFGGSAGGSLRTNAHTTHGVGSIVADGLGMNFDGGDGGDE